MPFLILLLLAGTLQASSDFQRRSYQAGKLKGSVPLIDGSLEDSAWEAVPWTGDFLVHSPERGAPPTRETKVRMLYDDEAIYFAFRAYDDPELIESRLGRRDQFPGDWVEVNIDSRNDKRTAFSFTLSVSGVQGDEAISEDGDNWDGNWNPIWFSGTRVDEEGWTAEMKIPYSQLRFPEQREHTWGIQITRRIQRAEERSTWQPMPLNAPGWVSYFGEIRGIRDIPAGGDAELVPYTVARNQYEDVASGRYGGPDQDLRVGMDGKWLLGRDFVANFTLNPDFGQVEADPAQINLSAFETFFSEKRPFFIEGREAFAFGLSQAVTGGGFNSDNLFYSRRIGRRPQGAWQEAAADEEDLVEAPVNSTILGALKLNGKTPGGWTIGLIESVTAEETGLLEHEDTGAQREVIVEPMTHYGVLRLRREMNGGNTVIGGLLTSANRRLEAAHIEERMHRNALSGGLDLSHNLDGERRYYLGARLAGSRVSGSAEAIRRTQESSAHYFQRPDAAHLELDTTATVLSGASVYAHLGRNRQGGLLAWQTGFSLRTPGFESNDLGYLRQADQLVQFGWAGLNQRTPSDWYLDWQLNGNEWIEMNSDRELLGTALNFNGSLRFKSRHQVGGSLSWDSDYKNPTLLRGGPSFQTPAVLNMDAWHNLPDLGRVGAGYGASYRIGAEGLNEGGSAWCEVWARPWPFLALSLNPSISRQTYGFQFLPVDDDEGAASTPWLLASLKRDTYVLTGRVSYYPRPGMSLQFYSELYVTQGKYSDWRRVADPLASSLEARTRSLSDNERTWDEDDEIWRVQESGGDHYTVEEPDFDDLGLNTNLVYRWEYSPGSELYLVWTRSGWSDLDPHGYKPLRNTFDHGEVPSRQIFLVKVSRWFDL